MDLLNMIKNQIQKYPDRTFTIVLNNNVLNYSTEADKSRIVKAKYRKDKYHTGLVVGYFTKIGSEMKLRHIDEVVEKLGDEVLNTYVGDINLADYIKDVEKIDIRVNGDFNVIEITTPAYKIAKQIATQNEGAMTKGAIGGVTIEVYTMTQIYNWFTKYAIESYHNVLKYILIRKFKESQEMKFYFLLNAFVPVMVHGDSSSFLFNPFLGLPMYRSEMDNSKLMFLASQTVKEYYGLNVYFLTAKEICQCFNLNKFVRFNYEFLIEILGGWFCDAMPTTNQEFYILTVADEDLPQAISVEEYNDSDWARGNYRKISTLTYACMIYARSLEVPDRQVQDFCELMSKRSLLNA